ncbi:hypothetical protein [Streptomyces sp. AB3(2024)]|uniref:hypothetical protein n=1 Tax=Streptomyces sp. AB3(2024) TaxID=3317321 RepID=UPI0035A35491
MGIRSRGEPTAYCRSPSALVSVLVPAPNTIPSWPRTGPHAVSTVEMPRPWRKTMLPPVEVPAVDPARTGSGSGTGSRARVGGGRPAGFGGGLCRGRPGQECHDDGGPGRGRP